MFCKNCGKENKDKAKFCSSCGGSLINEQQAQESSGEAEATSEQESSGEAEAASEQDDVIDPESVSEAEVASEPEFSGDAEAVSNPESQPDFLPESSQDFSPQMYEQQQLHNQQPLKYKGYSPIASEDSSMSATGSKKKFLVILICLILVIVAAIILMFTIGPFADINPLLNKKPLDKAHENNKILGNNSEKQHDNLNIELIQSDYSEFPTVRHYFSVTDFDTGEVISDKELTRVKLMEQLGEKDLEEINGVTMKTLNNNEGIAVNIVADVSSSMGFEGIEMSKDSISKFLGDMQFDKEDSAELTTFSDSVYLLQEFTDEEQLLQNSLSSIDMQSNTALYDALFTAVNRTALQSGAKCVIAYTDGMDNASNASKESVVLLAQSQKIPIYIIGIGDVSETDLTYIAESTGGRYMNSYDAEGLYNIYDEIFKEAKDLIMLEYEDTSSKTIREPRKMVLNIDGDNYGGQCDLEYTPNIIKGIGEEENYVDEYDKCVSDYLNGFVKGINVNDFSILEPAVFPNSPIYKMQKDYLENRKATEQLISYEIMSVNSVDSETATVKVKELYEINNYEEPIHIKLFENIYTIKKSNGEWKFYSLDELLIIEKTN